ncbi:NAD-dependent epimerase/dehydratase family protein [Planctomicrobium piriforme]|uniref:Nucleoside-diphosphate-sugar epimerase n=1 Tax=Planctomicrobium piriforme TaxID=1576369 RepID=A0A1I3MQG4_9PLAN|nr:NAD(P)-dependent oxidoreductase [Planctomicrobium piriforme]SFI99223.1 Nucleoside-diphosphate-sugar epimerase [Planctomicrobium piriforme]
MKRIFITGSAGFIGSYLVKEFLDAGWEVVGLDNFSKYGELTPAHAGHPRYKFHRGDAKDAALLDSLLEGCHHFIAGAAMIGGIAYFHRLAFDLLAENERLTASAFEAAIRAHKRGTLEKITVLSSSMVFENATEFPTPETAVKISPPPSSTYGFQKLACEYFAYGALTQYGLPYTIIRPFNCVGIGERRATADEEVMSGDVKLALSHVVPDLAQKVLKGQDPLHILGDGQQVRHYTYGGDLARGIRVCVEHPAALNEDFNISTAVATTVLELAEAIWKQVHGPDVPLRFVSDPPFPHDVQHRSPNVDKAKKMLGFEATTPLDVILDEVIPWIRTQIDQGTI